MGWLDSVKRGFGKPAPVHHSDDAATADPQTEPARLVIPEIQPADLIPLYRAGEAPKLIDCREPFEWQQVRIPGSLHIPMNQIPARLAELDKKSEWVVVCAHGNRSYSVAGFLIVNGYQAASLAGGVTDWTMRGGEVESELRR
jgi:rhodanese-related sulfurtransferase